jgi:hypothetical protein
LTVFSKKGHLLQFPHLGKDIVLLDDKYFVEYAESENKEKQFDKMKDAVLDNLDTILSKNESSIYKIEKEFLFFYEKLK